VAEFTESRGAGDINRHNQKTTVSVRGSYDGEDAGKIREQVTVIMNGMQYPTGYSWSFGQRMVEREERDTQLLTNVALAIICVYLLMAALFESLLHPLVIMLCLPLAAVGVVLIMVLTATKMSFMAMIGVVILIGVVVNNGIVLIDHINNFRKKGFSMEDAVIEGGRERFRPIMMTAGTTILGLLPMAVGNAHVGDAQYYPLARAVMGGLISSTILTLLVLPTFYVFGEHVRVWAGRLWVQSRPHPRAPVPGQIDAAPREPL
jgi:HAE1 family hydrophobic/amphiphilic exporter-1